MDDYKAVILGTKDPATVLLGLEFTQKPVFFEARAMVRDNACMNLTYGLAYPTFRYKAKIQSETQAKPTASLNVNAPSLAPSGVVQEVAVGVKLGSEDTPEIPDPQKDPNQASSTPGITPAG